MNEKLTDHLTKSFGTVFSVDTRKIMIKITEEEDLNTLKINDIVILSGNNEDERLIGIITKVTKKLVDYIEAEDDTEQEISFSDNVAVISLVGTFYQIYQGVKNQFKRAINTYPEINSEVFFAYPKALSIIMNSLSIGDSKTEKLKIGRFASNKEVSAILDGNRFFQRHAAIVGSTGSGKSYAVANILEKINKLPYGNAIVFDLHGEYNELTYAKQIKIGSVGVGILLLLTYPVQKLTANVVPKLLDMVSKRIDCVLTEKELSRLLFLSFF